MGDKGPREMHVPVLLLCFRYYTKLAPHDNRGWLDGIKQRVSCLRQIAAICGKMRQVDAARLMLHKHGLLLIHFN